MIRVTITLDAALAAALRAEARREGCPVSGVARRAFACQLSRGGADTRAVPADLAEGSHPTPERPGPSNLHVTAPASAEKPLPSRRSRAPLPQAPLQKGGR